MVIQGSLVGLDGAVIENCLCAHDIECSGLHLFAARLGGKCIILDDNTIGNEIVRLYGDSATTTGGEDLAILALGHGSIIPDDNSRVGGIRL